MQTTYDKHELFDKYNLTIGLLRRLCQEGHVSHVGKNQYILTNMKLFDDFNVEDYKAQLRQEAHQKQSKSMKLARQNESEAAKAQRYERSSASHKLRWASYSDERRQEICNTCKQSITIAMHTEETRKHCSDAQQLWWSKAPQEWIDKRGKKIGSSNRQRLIDNPEERIKISYKRKATYKKYNGKIQEKRNATKRKNGTFNTSKDEEHSYELLLKHFDKDDIIRSHKTKEYPFFCDFYIKSLNLYIEGHYSQFHHYEPFDLANEEHLKELKLLQEAFERTPKNSKGTNQYGQMISEWTVRDPKKLQCAIDNKLNWIAFYRVSELEKFLLEEQYKQKENK